MAEGAPRGGALSSLARLLRGHPAKVNLIPFNPFPGTQYRRSRPEVIRTFLDQILKGGVMATIRRTRGDDIDAACGQLAGRVHDRTTSRLGDKLAGTQVEGERTRLGSRPVAVPVVVQPAEAPVVRP